MHKSTRMLLASILTLAPLTLGHGQEPLTQPLVTFDLVGTFPANVPVTRMTAPNAAFLLEISFNQTVPAITQSTFALDAAPVSGTYSFEGRTYHVTSGNLDEHNHNLNYRNLTVTTPIGTLSFSSGGGEQGPYPTYWVGLPLRSNAPSAGYASGSVTFLTRDSGTTGSISNWNYTFTNVYGKSVTGYYANVLDIVGRLVMPKPAALAEAQ